MTSMEEMRQIERWTRESDSRVVRTKIFFLAEKVECCQRHKRVYDELRKDFLEFADMSHLLHWGVIRQYVNHCLTEYRAITTTPCH